MKRLMRGRTTFVITHRPGALRWATMTVRIDGGGLRVEDNRHAPELLKAS
jgi:ABC-type multidrug transport system fused ATPase/permease subunit